MSWCHGNDRRTRSLDHFRFFQPKFFQSRIPEVCWRLATARTLTSLQAEVLNAYEAWKSRPWWAWNHCTKLTTGLGNCHLQSQGSEIEINTTSRHQESLWKSINMRCEYQVQHWVLETRKVLISSNFAGNFQFKVFQADEFQAHRAGRSETLMSNWWIYHLLKIRQPMPLANKMYNYLCILILTYTYRIQIASIPKSCCVGLTQTSWVRLSGWLEDGHGAFGDRDSSGCLWSAQLNLDWRRSHALRSEDASHWGQKHDEAHWLFLLKKVTISELQVLQRFSAFACQGVLQWRKVSRNIFCNGMDFMHVARLFAWSKLWSASCHSEHGKKRLNDGCAMLCHFNLLISTVFKTFNYFRCQGCMKSAKSKQLKSFHACFSSCPTTAFPCLESYSWGPDMVSSQMLETSGTASEFLAPLGLANFPKASEALVSQNPFWSSKKGK